MEYCFLCEEYPCQRLQDSLEFDSFLTHQHMLRDLDRAQKMGMETYLEELGEKTAILEKLLAGYNDGRRKSFFCLAVNLLELSDCQEVWEEISSQTTGAPIPQGTGRFGGEAVSGAG